MGGLVSSSIANLISGVSQQPWNVRLATQAEEQINCYSSVTEFLKRRPATTHVARLFEELPASGAVLHGINRDRNERYLVMAHAGGVRVTDLSGAAREVNMAEGALAYLADIEDANDDLRFLTISDYTFVLNRKKVTAMGAELSPTRPPEAIVFIKQASYNTTYTVTVNGSSFSFTTLDGVAPADEPADSLSSREIAEKLAEQIRGSWSGGTVTCSHSTIWLKSSGAEFTIKAEDTRSNTHISLCKGTVQRFSDLPTVAPRGFVTEIVGDSSSSFDNYYCAFEPLDSQSSFGTGVWKETVKPGMPYKLDPATMPHALIRQADGSFSFGPLEWGERVCGDDESAPEPSFCGKTLNGMFFYRNRLAFLSGENVIMSEAGEFFNFFATTVTTMVDSDVIDVAASHTKSSILEHAAAFSGGLLLFSAQSQFVLEHDAVLANSTVSVKPVTEFEASMKAAPVSSGKTVLFATDKGEYGGVREYLTLPDASDQNDAADVTAHVPRYIPGDICDLICSTGEDILFARSKTNLSSIWVYKYFWNGAEKIQSSWSRWDMAGDVLAVMFVNSEAYFAICYPEGVFLEKMRFVPGYVDEGCDFECCLDRKITEAGLLGASYDSLTRETLVTLPYQPGPKAVVVTRTREDRPDEVPGRALTVLGVEGNTLRLSGDQTQTPFFVGVPYASRYTFSTQAVRDQATGNAVTAGRLQLRRITINCVKTGYLELHVTPAFRETSVHVFTGKSLGHGTNVLGRVPLYTGAVKCPVLARNTEASITAASDSFLPFALVDAWWEGFYNSRG